MLYLTTSKTETHDYNLTKVMWKYALLINGLLFVLAWGLLELMKGKG